MVLLSGTDLRLALFFGEPSSRPRSLTLRERRTSLRVGICGICGIFEPSSPAFGLSEPLSMFCFREYPQNRDSLRSFSRRKPCGVGSLHTYRLFGRLLELNDHGDD